MIFSLLVMDDEEHLLVDNKRNHGDTDLGVQSTLEQKVLDFHGEQSCCQKLCRSAKQSLLNPAHLGACILKDTIHLIRNKPLMIFQFILPFIQISILLLAIGGNPKDVPVGVFNEDKGIADVYLSNQFLDFVNTGSLLQLHYYDSKQSLQDAAHRAQVTGTVHFGANYSIDLVKRGTSFKDTTVETALGGSVYISLDQTVLMTAMLLEEKFMEAFAQFGFQLVNNVTHNPAITILPINFTKPFYGEEVKTFTDYMAPGVILQLTYAMSVSLTGIGAIIERKLGLVDRLSASGVTETVLMLSLMTVQCFIMTGQLCILFVMALLVFDTPFMGNIALAILIAYLQGVSGLVFGIIVSAVCTEETQAMQLSLGTFYPIMLLSGVIWPLDAIPYPLRYISYALPPTLPAAAMRDVFLRGWGISYREVWGGILVNVGFICLFLTIAVVIRKILWYNR